MGTTSVAPEWRDYPGAEAEGHTVSGTVKAVEIESLELGNSRQVYVYLPPAYGSDPDRRFPVLYMHDGQNLFDVATAHGEEWGIDEAMEAAPAEQAAIVVGISNAGEKRLEEYSPFADPKHGGGSGARYARFVVETIKPLIDESFRTRPGRETTLIAGSSMGGLISLFSYFEYPDVFGAVGAMSPALWFAERSIFTYLRNAPYRPGRIYLDVGSEEGFRVVRDVRRARDLLYRKGYDAVTELHYVEEKGAGHTERAWSARFRATLPFLLGRET